MSGERLISSSWRKSLNSLSQRKGDGFKGLWGNKKHSEELEFKRVSDSMGFRGTWNMVND